MRLLSHFKALGVTYEGCFFVSLCFILFAGSVATDVGVVFHEDASGNVIVADDGLPLGIDHWTTFWAGWPQNLLILGAVFSALLALVLWMDSVICRLRK